MFFTVILKARVQPAYGGA